MIARRPMGDLRQLQLAEMLAQRGKRPTPIDAAAAFRYRFRHEPKLTVSAAVNNRTADIASRHRPVSGQF